MAELPPTPTEVPKPDPPKPPEHPPLDRAALIAAYPSQAPGTADKKTGGQDPAAPKTDAAKTDVAKTDAAKVDAPKADAAKVDLTKSLSDAWNQASDAVVGTAKDLGNAAKDLGNAAKDLGNEVVAEVSKDVGKVEAAVKPGGVVFEGADHFVNPNASEHPEQAAVMNNLAKRGEGIADGVTHGLKAEGDSLGNLAYYGTHVNEPGASDKALAELKYQAAAPERAAEDVVKGTAQLVESVGKAGDAAAYYGVMHTDEPGAAAKTADALTNLAMDVPQLVLAVDGAAGLGESVVAGGLSEAETAAAAERAYKIEPPKIEPPKVEPTETGAAGDARAAQPAEATATPKSADAPSELAKASPANDNAVPRGQANEQVMAPTGTDGAVAGGQPKLNVIEGGKANPDAPRAMAGDPPGPRAPGDAPRPSTAGTDPVVSPEKAGQGGAREAGAGGDKPGTTPKAANEVKPANDNATPPAQADSAEGKLTITKPEHGELRFDNGKGDPVTLVNRSEPVLGTERSAEYQVKATGQENETLLYFEKDQKIHRVDGFYDQLGDKSRVIIEAKMSPYSDLLNPNRVQSGYDQAITHVRAAEAIDGSVLYRIGGTQSGVDAVKNLFSQDPALNAAMQSGRLSVELFKF